MEILDISRIVFALIAVIGMIGLFGFGARKLGFSSGTFALARDRRLAVVEVLPLDARRKMAIVRCDGREHLLVLNPNSVTIVERGVEREIEAGADTPGEPQVANADSPSPSPFLSRLATQLRRAEARPAQ